KRADRDGFGDPKASVGGLLTASDDPLSSLRERSLIGGVQLQWETLNKQLTHQLHFKYNSSTTSDADFAFGPAFITTNDSERTTYGYVGTYRFETPALWAAKHALSALIEKETETFVPRGNDLVDGIKRERDRLAVAGEWRGTFADQVFITAGVR